MKIGICHFVMKRRACFALICRVLALSLPAVLFGCSFFTINTMHNEPLPASQSQMRATRASQNLSVDDLPNGVFIGIALSGGGSRAANFSAAALLELEKLGILQNTAVISSVSGSSLVAAYYGLYGCKPDRWNSEMVREQFGKDFEWQWFLRWFDPGNAVQYWFTNFNRSDIMAEELDSELYAGKEFKDMCPAQEKRKGTPRILINATSYTTGHQFVFSDEQFENKLHSRLDTYPIANAVMASSAFPVVFHDITLKDYRIKDRALSANEPGDEIENFEHLIDGGPSDNLGTEPLVEIIEKLYGDPDQHDKQPKACFLFVVDAFPYQEFADGVQIADTRNWYDFILDTNVATSSDVLLAVRRVDLLNKFGIDVGAKDLIPYIRAKEDPKRAIDHCTVWHLSLQRMYSPSFETVVNLEEPDELRQLRQIRKVANETPTRYKLPEVFGYSPDSVQDYLFKAANILVRNDRLNAGGKFIFQDLCEHISNHASGFQCHLNE